MNLDLLALGERLGKKYEARISSWGRDDEGNRKVGGHPNSWHRWDRGANAIDLAVSAVNEQGKKRAEWIAEEARNEGYETIVYERKGDDGNLYYQVHIEVRW